MPGTATPATAVVEDCGSASIKTRRQATNSLWTKDTKGLLISVPPPQVMSAVPSTAIPTLNHDAVKSQQQPTSPQVVAAASSEAVEYCTPEGKRRVRLPGIGSLPPIKDHHHDHVRQSVLPSAPPHTALPSIKDPSTVLDKYRWSPYTTDKMARTPSNPLPSRRVSSRIRMLESPMTSEDRRQLAALKPDL
ncbi:hypothetical protein EV182_005315 [Spiromyces aspiralis]|uniref:Uncharacterized protein n=1 Tax=Spiromyces aspiralis TaxID=68401 RepID=A0ACC1HMS6_9FUNG|nr:hypothetical protein EV182_005315 [Spiromyces aspiralis]